MALNLAQRPGMLSRIIFSAPVAVAVCLSCLFCPSLVLEHPGTADAIVLCVMLIADSPYASVIMHNFLL